MFSKEYFKDYNYKKHAKICLGVYGVLLAVDMTASYFILKKAFAKMEERGFLDE